MKIARVFPRRIKATPIDALAFTDVPGLFPPEVDEVHVSVTFTWDIPRAKRLGHQWEHIAPVKYGGPAYGEPGGEFVPGRYLREGYTITSRGCPNKCWFCEVWKREPKLIELSIHPGHNILDDNLLACSDAHIKSVFSMLKTQKGREFTGGLEAKRLKQWHVDELKKIKVKQMFFAYDEPDDFEPLCNAAAMLSDAGFTRNQSRCYVLIGYPKDTMQEAEKRLQSVKAMNIAPFAMLYRDDNIEPDLEWSRFTRRWRLPAIIYSK